MLTRILKALAKPVSLVPERKAARQMHNANPMTMGFLYGSSVNQTESLVKNVGGNVETSVCVQDTSLRTQLFQQAHQQVKVAAEKALVKGPGAVVETSECVEDSLEARRHELALIKQEDSLSNPTFRR